MTSIFVTLIIITGLLILIGFHWIDKADEAERQRKEAEKKAEQKKKMMMNVSESKKKLIKFIIQK